MASARKPTHSCGPLMRSNCCCDSHSTTRRVSCKKGSISSAARTQACSPSLLLLLLLWDVTGFRGRRKEVEGWGDGVIVLESMWKWEGCVFCFFHPETHFQKSAFSVTAFSRSMWTVGQKDAIHLRFHKRVFSSGRPLRHKSLVFSLSHAVDAGTHLCACNANASSKSYRSVAVVKPDNTLSGYVAQLHAFIGCLLSWRACVCVCECVCVCVCAAQPVNKHTAEGQRDEREADTVLCMSTFLQMFLLVQIILSTCNILILWV